MLDNRVAYHWCQELSENLSDFRRKARLNPESKLTFISQQYSSLFSLVKVLRGDSVMYGVPIRMFVTDKHE